MTLSGANLTTRTTSVAYDNATGEFPHLLTDALGHQSTVTYDPKFGAQTGITDPNNVSQGSGYDSFGRQSSITKADGNESIITYAYCANVNGGSASCPTHGAYAVTVTPTEADGQTQNGPQSITYYDALDRVIATDVQGFDASGTAPWIRTSTNYDQYERVSQTSRPYFVSGGTAKWTSFSYDSIGRLSQETFPDSSQTTFCYHGPTTAVTNAKSQTKTTVLNEQGLVATIVQGTGVDSTCNPTGTGSTTTTYVYDAFGNPTLITDPGSNTVQNSFDKRGRKIAATAPDMGSWTYGYDALDELVSQTDAKQQQTTVTYDVLMRPTLRTEADLQSAWTWDTAQSGYGIGKLAQACTASNGTCLTDYQRTPSYDSSGRLTTDRLKISGTNYPYTVHYNADGRISRIDYPSGFTAKYIYTTLGYLSQIQDNSNQQVIWTANTRDAEMHLTQQTAGNSVMTTTQTFDPNTGNLLAVCSTSGIPPGCDGGIANLQYGWDSIGNLLWRSDTYQNTTENFCYDDFNRLQNYAFGASCTASGHKTMAYDSVGNITKKSDVCNTANCYVYGGSGPHELTSIVGTYAGVTNPNFGYDLNGNMICMYAPGQTCGGLNTSRIVTWTSFNMMNQLSQSGVMPSGLQLSYGAEHQRIKMCSPTCAGATGTTYYLYDPGSRAASEKYVSGGTTTWRDYIEADGGIVAERFQGATTTWKYFVLDHLGSTARLTDSAQNIERDSYDAWGKRRNADGTDNPTCSLTSATTRGYTGHEMLDSFCLANMNARIYDATLGRFLSADSVIPDPLDGQSYNRCSYVIDNPLAYTDPTGHDDVEEVIVWGHRWYQMGELQGEREQGVYNVDRGAGEDRNRDRNQAKKKPSCGAIMVRDVGHFLAVAGGAGAAVTGTATLLADGAEVSTGIGAPATIPTTIGGFAVTGGWTVLGIAGTGVEFLGRGMIAYDTGSWGDFRKAGILEGVGDVLSVGAQAMAEDKLPISDLLGKLATDALSGNESNSCAE